MKCALRISDDTGHVALVVALGAHQILGVHQADDVICAPAEHRQPAVSVQEHDLHRVGHAEVARHAHHVGAGHHHLAYHRVAELDDLLDELPLAFFEHLFFDGDVGQRQQLLLGDERAFLQALARAGSSSSDRSERATACAAARTRRGAETGPDDTSAARSGFWMAHVFGAASHNTNTITTLKKVAMAMPIAPNKRSATMPVSVACTSWHTNTTSSTGFRNRLRMGDQPQQLVAAGSVVFGQGLRLRLRHARERGLGNGEIGRDQQQHDDRDDHRQIGAREGVGEHHAQLHGSRASGP